MSARPDTDDYRALFLSPTPMMDMRAPAEFTRGAFPSALSLPLMSDEEREQVGICYKQQGQEAAIALGHQLVSGELKERRLAQWADFARQHPAGYLYCFRGGLRSQTVQHWLREAGIDYPRVIGGSKAMRHFLLEELERSVAQASFTLVSGKNRYRQNPSHFPSVPGGGPGGTGESPRVQLRADAYAATQPNRF